MTMMKVMRKKKRNQQRKNVFALERNLIENIRTDQVTNELKIPKNEFIIY
jgi:hypothetical protein